ncbi:porin [Chitinimonas sp. BJB300]|uniref:porin n=1 Tax=Chitinimonas sp. BJB300 TaxID=1559339 RepID=UPI001304757D|nr:porin [Chitinimonas sp. BJB300]
MRTTLIAVAVLGALSAPSFADDNNITLYGQVNVAGLYKNDGATKQFKVDSAYTGSRIGIKGQESLGNGLKAFFQVETKIRPDDATEGSFGSREGWVGLQSEFGKVSLGRGKTPYTNIADWFDNYVDLANGLAVQENKQANGGNVLDSRWNNAVRFDSQDINGFTMSAMVGAGENKDNAKGVKASNNAALSGRYVLGPMQLGAAYASQKNKDSGTVTTGSQIGNHSAFLLAGSYAIDEFTVALGFQAGKVDSSVPGQDTKRNSFLMAASYQLGATNLRAGAIINDKLKKDGVKVADSDFVRYSLGAKHNLSKRTALVAEVSGDKNKGATKNLTYVGVGAMHAF